MTPHTTPDEPRSSSGIHALISAWSAARDPFVGYVTGVAEAFQTSGLTVPEAAKWVDAQEAELWAVLRLGSLDEESLTLFEGAPPPKTSWLDLAEATPAGIRQALQRLSKLKPGASPHLAAIEAIREVEGPTTHERVAALSGKTLSHLHEKAKQYNALNDGSLRALKQFAMRKKFGQGLTPRQVAWLHDMLVDLADNGVIKRKSPDGDTEHCDAALDAIHR
jgi:hypothetical protein